MWTMIGEWIRGILGIFGAFRGSWLAKVDRDHNMRSVCRRAGSERRNDLDGKEMPSAEADGLSQPTAEYRAGASWPASRLSETT